MRKAFTFYSSYYESIKELPLENQHELYKGIVEYSFEKIEQNFNGISNAIWQLIKPNIDSNISRYECGKTPKNKGKKGNEKSETKAKAKQSKSDALSLILSINYYSNLELNNIFIEFIKLREKLKAVNSERAIKELMNTLSEYDDDTKILMIKKSIKNSWKDVYPIKEQPKGQAVPSWVGKEIPKEKMSKEEETELKNMLEEFK